MKWIIILVLYSPDNAFEPSRVIPQNGDYSSHEQCIEQAYLYTRAANAILTNRATATVFGCKQI